MCGICGFVGFEDRKLLKEMMAAISHRGPDGSGIFSDKNVMLGHQRLSIIDLGGGSQPIFNEKKDICIVFNGEIYNYRQLREELETKGHTFETNSDTETIVHGYEEYGPAIVERLDGDFAFALWDGRKKELMLARDHIGVKPLYYMKTDEGIAFASETKALLQLPNERLLNRQGVNEFFRYGYVLGPHTLLEGIKKVLPGEVITFANGRLKKKKYWVPQFAEKRHPEEEIIKKAKSLLSAATEERLMSDVPLGIFLSGGLDSSTLVAMLAEKGYESLKTFSVGFGHETDELKYAKIVADEYSTDHKELLVNLQRSEIPQITWHLDEPLANAAAIPTYFMSKEAKKHVTVVLTGDGGDEVFGGYDRYVTTNMLARTLTPIPSALFKPLPGNYGRRLAEIDEKNKDVKLFLAYRAQFSEKERRSLLGPLWEKIDLPRFEKQLSLTNNMISFDFQSLLPDDYLMKVDKTTMAHGIESRVPYLDKQLVEYMSSIAGNYKVHGLQKKYVLKKFAKSMLPPAIFSKKKQGFNVPTQQWLAQGLREEAEHLFDRTTIISNSYCTKILEKYHRQPRYYTRQFWGAYSFAMWHKIYLEEQAKNLKQVKQIQRSL